MGKGLLSQFDKGGSCPAQCGGSYGTLRQPLLGATRLSHGIGSHQPLRSASPYHGRRKAVMVFAPNLARQCHGPGHNLHSRNMWTWAGHVG